MPEDKPGEFYTLSYARNFNPTHGVYTAYARHIRKEMIPALLIELSKLYFRQLNPEQEIEVGVQDEKKVVSGVSGEPVRYQCTNCLTVYDPAYGDPMAKIAPGVSFKDLPSSYTCHVCDSPKEFFSPIGTTER